MTFLKSVLALLPTFLIIPHVTFAQKSVTSAIVNQKYLDSVLSAAKKYNSKMKFYKSSFKPFHIDDPGTEQWIDYEKYGEFQNLGQSNYRYAVNDLEGLRKASGAGREYFQIDKVFIKKRLTKNILNRASWKAISGIL
ncbi:MAG: hypothetical protein LBS61_02585 [Endomicrobium sp.]|nr:hypothetical protein [Endomicrobium sp.]